MGVIKSGNSLLLLRERLSLAGLALVTVASSMLEVLGIGLLYPYISLLQNPNLVAGNRYLSLLYHGLGFSTYRSFAIMVSLGLLLLFCIKGIASIWANNLQLRFVFGLLTRLGEDLLSGYLQRPYVFFLTANTSDVITNITGALGRACTGVIQGMLVVASESLVLAGLVAVLLYYNFLFTITAAAFLAGLAGAYIFAVKHRISELGGLAERYWGRMIRIVNEAISSAKEVQTLGRQDYFVDAYRSATTASATTYEKSSFYAQLSRVTLETGTVGGMVLLCMFALATNRLGPNLFPVLALFALATIRILPSITRIMTGWNNIAFNRAALQTIAELYAQGPASRTRTPRPVGPPLRLNNSMEIQVRRFGYPANPHFELKNIDVRIERGQTLAFIGHSGSGKTTMADLILGLFSDFEGAIRVDGRDIRGSIPEWRRSIGYIPQNIYLRDDTIARNIAFGVPDDEIDTAHINRAVHLAGLEDVVAAQSSGINTIVGDRGIRLSGGERQRIGIARALYHDPDLLLLDEATSALDNQTEQRIADSILNLSPAKTIIIIAHRLSTVQHCDRIYLMGGGRILDHGSFADIAMRHPDFVSPKRGKRENADIADAAG